MKSMTMTMDGGMSDVTRKRLMTGGLMLLVVLATMLMCDPTWAQVGGATGNQAAVQTRVTSVTSQFQQIMFAVGAVILTAAAMYVGYGMAYNGKKWSDVANVAYGSTIAGMAPLLIGWLFL